MVDAGHDLTEVVGRDVGRHADGDAGCAIDQEIRYPGRQHGRLLLGAVVVLLEVDGVLVDVGEHLVGDPGEPRLGVPHRRGRVAVDRAEITLAVDQRVAEREGLRHPNHRVIDGGVAVRVIELHHLAHEGGALLVARPGGGTFAKHGVEDAALHRL